MHLPAWACVLLSGCAPLLAPEAAVRSDACCEPAAPPAPAETLDEGSDYAAAVYGPARCADAAARRLASDANEAWRQLRGCVDRGRFTALRNLLSGAWDHELQTRRDAPELLARVIAMRGGDVEADLRLLHERYVPLFSLAQALAQPERFRGTLVIVRARVSPSGVVDEQRLARSVAGVELGPSE